MPDNFNSDNSMEAHPSSTPSSNYKIKMLPNKQLKVDSKMISKYETFAPCIQKTGFLGLVKKSRKKTIKAVPIYVSINKSHFSLFKSTKDSSLFKAVKLKKVQSIAQKLKGTSCFDVLVEKGSTFTLCAKSMKEMKDWVVSVEEFKKCALRDEKGMLVDFTKLNKFAKQAKKSRAKKRFNIDKLFYDTRKMPFLRRARTGSNLIRSGGRSPSIRSSNPANVVGLLNAGSTMKNILKTIKMGNLAKRQLKRNLLNKLKAAKKFTKEVSNKKKMIKSLMKRRSKKTHIHSIVRQKEEFKLLQEMQKKIKALKLKQLNEYKKRFEFKILRERRKAKEKAKKLMKVIMEQQKLTDYSVCYNDKLKHFHDNPYSMTMCRQYYGDSGYKTCNSRSTFCDSCCDFHIGVNFPDKKLECFKKCDAVVNGERRKRIKPRKAEKKKRSKINQLLFAELQSNRVKDYLKKSLFKDLSKSKADAKKAK